LQVIERVQRKEQLEYAHTAAVHALALEQLLRNVDGSELEILLALARRQGLVEDHLTRR